VPLLHTMHHGRCNWTTILVLSVMDISICEWLWISDTCVYKCMDPLGVGVWVEIGGVKFYTMSLFVKVNCVSAPYFLLRNPYWICYEIILSTLHRPASDSDDLDVPHYQCYLKCSAVCHVYIVQLLCEVTDYFERKFSGLVYWL
jgi:hypothetical protein